MDIDLKQWLSVFLISFCVISGEINAQAGMLTKPGNIKKVFSQTKLQSIDSGKLKTAPFANAGKSGRVFKPGSPVIKPVKHRWLAYKGESLQSLTVRWAEYVGYQVVWEAPYDYPINASFELTGDFPGVIKQLFDEFSDSERPMKIDIYNQQKLVHVGSF
ncbi:hypothetical protein ZY50_22505 [Salmonella enterica subsp. enterica]|nr:hypothetical protein [Salmonella enterica subsp. enterica serovar Newport]EAB5694147.1 hypothetical protein [Salmonella enterica subsp. enterica serovar Newport]EBU6996601.1 hypothetical protein [Salmonella enterica subsp. enterica serovar Newport]EEB7956804.1 hypothetical protein [Salmonella enterica subsp. enterica serovar Newport]